MNQLSSGNTICIHGRTRVKGQPATIPMYVYTLNIYWGTCYIRMYTCSVQPSNSISTMRHFSLKQLSTVVERGVGTYYLFVYVQNGITHIFNRIFMIPSTDSRYVVDPTFNWPVCLSPPPPLPLLLLHTPMHAFVKPGQARLGQLCDCDFLLQDNFVKVNIRFHGSLSLSHTHLLLHAL